MAQSAANSAQPGTYRALIEQYEERFRGGVEAGEYEPFVYPYRFYGLFLIIAYLLLPPTSSRLVHYAKYPIFAFFAYWSVKAVVETKSPCHPWSYGIGIIQMWSVTWIASLVVFRDARTEAKRVERRRRDPAPADGGLGHGENATSAIDGDGGVRRCRADGNKTQRTADGSANPKDLTKPEYEYHWQALPSSFRDRLDWVCDLGASLRGAGWSHQIRTIPPPPPEITSTLPSPPRVHPTVRTHLSRRALLRSNLVCAARTYLVLDLTKAAMTLDAYFLGAGPTAPPPSYLPTAITSSAILTRIYRLLLSLLGIKYSLQLIFTLSPLLLAGPLRHLQIPGAGPRAAAIWIFPDFYGSTVALADDGLAGWWGAWWHQLFRLGFEVPTAWAIARLGWDPRGQRAKALGLAIAFGCSGVVHGCASYTQLLETRPVRGPFAFFALQGIGLAGERAARAWLREVGATQKTPKALRRGCTFLSLMVWMYFTAPFLVDDFARGGIWLFEPVPISPIRGLGFGPEGEGWWCWWGRNVKWHRGERWWKSGIEF